MPIVRLYPVGEVSPQPLPNAQINVPAAGDINLFGGNRAQDLQLAGQRLGQASDSLFAIYECQAKAANDVRVQDANNQYIDGTREILRTGPDAYYKQNGADAIVGAAATIEKLTTLKDRLLGQAPNDYQRQKLRPILDAHLAASADAVARHVDDQQAAYGRKVAATAIETSRTDAVANPANLPNAMLRAEGAARALYGGQGPEIVEAEGRKAGLSLVSAVIGDQLGRNDPEGLALFRRYRDQLDPRERHVLGAAAEMLTNTIAAADWLRDRGASLPAAPAPTGDAALDAVNVASLSTADPPPVTSWGGRLLNHDSVLGYRERLTEIEDRRHALTALNEQEFASHPARLRANRTAIETDTAWNRAAAEAEADKAYADLQRHLATSGPDGGPAVTLPPATLLSRFTDEQQAAIAAQVNRAIEGRKTRTDAPTWYAIHQGLTGDDADERERWAHVNLIQFRGQLSEEDFAALTKLQTTVRTNDGGAEATRVQAITRIANRALLAAGIDPTLGSESVAVQAATFHRALQDELSTFESKDRMATMADAQDIVDRLTTTAFKGAWFKASDRNDFLIKASHIPSTDDAFSKDDVFLAQAEPDEDKSLRPDSEPSRTEQDPRLDTERERQAQKRLDEEETAARKADRGNMTPVKIDRWLSEWLSNYWPGDAAPPEIPAGLAERLTAGQKAEIEDIVSGGADTKTDPRVLEQIRRSLRSKDSTERLKWANEPLYRYRPWLSPSDYHQLTIEQAQIDPKTGAKNGAAGNPFGTLEEHVELAIDLSAARAVGWVYRAGRWVLEKVAGSNTAPPGKDVTTAEGPNPTGAVEIAAKAGETTLSKRGMTDAHDGRGEDLFIELREKRLPRPIPHQEKDGPEPVPLSSLDEERRKGMAGANYAQKKYGATYNEEGRLRGWAIDDAVEALLARKLSPKDLYVDFVLKDGYWLMHNTRTPQALLKAGLPMKDWFVRDMTKDQETVDRVREQLMRNKLPNEGTPTVEPSKKKGGQ